METTEVAYVETMQAHDIKGIALDTQFQGEMARAEIEITDIVDKREDSSPSVIKIDDEESREEDAPIKVTFGADVIHKKVSRGRGELSSRLKNKAAKSCSRPTVFERLSNAETKASIHRKLESRQIRKRSTSAPPSLLRSGVVSNNLTVATPVVSSFGNGNAKQLPFKVISSNSRRNGTKKEEKVTQPSRSTFKLPLQLSFDRLAESHTKLSKIRQRRPPLPTEKQSRKSSFGKRGRGIGIGARRVRSTSNGRLFESPLLQIEGMEENEYNDDRDRQQIIEQKKFDDELSSVAAMSVPCEIEFTSRMQIYTTNTHKPEDGYQELDPFDYELNGSLSQYEAGGLSVKDLSSEIVSMLLLGDLPHDIDWCLRTPLYRDLALPLGEVGYSFFLEVHENGNGGEKTLSSASATGNIIFIHDLSEIHIENYSFVLDDI